MEEEKRVRVRRRLVIVKKYSRHERRTEPMVRFSGKIKITGITGLSKRGFEKNH